MRSPVILFYYVLALANVLALALPQPANQVSKRQPTSLEERATFNGRWTFYNVGLGACGVRNVASDFVVALNTDQWGGGSHCGQKITMTFGGKTTVATIVDECPTCPPFGLDLSTGLFSFFAPLSDGAIDGTWTLT